MADEEAVHVPLLDVSQRDHESRARRQRRDPPYAITVRQLRWATSIIIACTFLDFFVALYLGFHTTHAIDSIQDLTVRSQYINLDVLYRHTQSTTHHPPIINHTPDFARVSSSDPRRVFPLPTDGWRSAYGLLPPRAQHLFVTTDISTVVQFRVFDFGMEKCSLAITAPPSESSVDADLDVWSLSTSQKLNFQDLSWFTLPSLRIHLGTLRVLYGSTSQMMNFTCPSGSYQTFLLSCGAPECQVDVVGDGQGQSGLYMYQYQTI